MLAKEPGESLFMRIETLARRAWRTAYWLPQDFMLWMRHGRPQTLVYCGGGGFGDDLLLSSVLYEFHRRGIRRLGVITRLTELFANFPWVETVIPEEWRIIEATRYFGGRAIHPKYLVHSENPLLENPPQEHIIAAMCRSAGLNGTIELRPRLVLTEEEKSKGNLLRDQAVVQITGPGSPNYEPLKDWNPANYQAVINAFPEIAWIQLGSKNDPPLAGVKDLRGQTSIRKSAAILSQSGFYFGYVGFLMHLARAVDCPAVIVYGGREHPIQSGYPCNLNIFSEIECSPCWRRRLCPNGLKCMTGIPQAQVREAITTLMRREKTLPLETLEADLS